MKYAKPLILANHERYLHDGLWSATRTCWT